MSEQRKDDENVIDTDEASVGGPSTHDPTGTRLRAETPGMLPPDELDRRQERIRTDRKKGGPDLGADAAGEEPEDVPPTETHPPPGPPPPPVP